MLTWGRLLIRMEFHGFKVDEDELSALVCAFFWVWYI